MIIDRAVVDSVISHQGLRCRARCLLNVMGQRQTTARRLSCLGFQRALVMVLDLIEGPIPGNIVIVMPTDHDFSVLLCLAARALIFCILVVNVLLLIMVMVVDFLFFVGPLVFIVDKLTSVLSKLLMDTWQLLAMDNLLMLGCCLMHHVRVVRLVGYVLD